MKIKQQGDADYSECDSAEFSKKIFALSEEINSNIQGLQEGTFSDALGFIERIKNYKISAIIWNKLYAIKGMPESGYDIDKYNMHFPDEPINNEKPIRRIF